jgi:glycosyltransferase involved in cell wall biosynthesis
VPATRAARVLASTPADFRMNDDAFGVYLDDVYLVVRTAEGDQVSTDRSFLLFVLEVGKAFQRRVLFGRAVPAGEPAEYVMPQDVELVELPHYESLRRFFEVLPTVAGTSRAFWRGLARVDTLWVFGPHPFAVLLAVMGIVRGKRVVLGVRQHSVRLYEARVTGWRRIPSLAAVRAVDLAYRLLARRLPVTVQGDELAAWYGADRRRVLPMGESVVRRSEVATRLTVRDWSGRVELLTVGRFETEKNPMLLVRALARLEAARPGRYHLTWVGRGPLEDEVLAEAKRLGVRELIELHGYIAFDAGLLDLYRRAHTFVHVSLSEGLPKVLIEALACGTPIVATDVGGVRAALDDGRAGVLVPPDDLEALVAAILRIDDEPELRDRLARHGLELAGELTMETQAERVVEFIGRSA